MRNPLMYQMYQMYADVTYPIRAIAKTAAPWLNNPASDWMKRSLMRQMLGAACDVTAMAGLSHHRPPFKLDNVVVGGKEVPIVEEVVAATPFCELLHFKKAGVAPQPRVLIVAPVSGHFATLLRATVQTMLRDHDVYITDWLNIRDVPLSVGDFGFDEYVEHVITFLEEMGAGVHVVAVCQPTVPVLVAASIMAEDGNPAQPTTMTLMAGPIDTRINPTEVNILAAGKPLAWFEKNVVSYVPLRYRGACRRVYPGFLQISAFMSMNMGRHVHSFIEMYANLIRREHEKADATREFYEEYFAMMDLSADFYLQTVQRVFQEHHLPLGIMQYKGRTVDPSKIKRTALFT
ncbi:MAG TPA: polyhydroxyalkanoate depolymerase, partial [Spongiibacteraceae bacterium]|nr:polyhydroxyalkanoate depolymerase [Spongiibacteraceae bacterium]